MQKYHKQHILKTMQLRYKLSKLKITKGPLT